MFGVGIGVLRQMTDRVFRTPDQVEAALHTECISIVPVVLSEEQGLDWALSAVGQAFLVVEA